MNRLSGKTAVVTGASKGIGAGIAKGLAAEGAAVVVNYASSKDGADRVVADIKAKGGKAIAVQGDVAKAADVKKIFAETKKACWRFSFIKLAEANMRRIAAALLRHIDRVSRSRARPAHMHGCRSSSLLRYCPLRSTGARNP